MGCSFSAVPKLEAAKSNAILDEFREISSEMSVDAMMRRTIRGILKVLPVERASVFLVDRHSGVMRTFNAMEYHSTPEMEEPASSQIVTIPIGSGLAGAVAKYAKTEIVADAQADERFNRSIDMHTGFKTRNVLSVPVLLKQATDLNNKRPPAVVAVLQALNRRGEFAANDCAVLELLAALLSGVLARSALVDAAVRERNRAASLFKVAEVVFTEGAPSRVKAASVIEAVKDGLNCERASMLLVDEVHAHSQGASHQGRARADGAAWGLGRHRRAQGGAYHVADAAPEGRGAGARL